MGYTPGARLGSGPDITEPFAALAKRRFSARVSRTSPWQGRQWQSATCARRLEHTHDKHGWPATQARQM